MRLLVTLLVTIVLVGYGSTRGFGRGGIKIGGFKPAYKPPAYRPPVYKPPVNKPVYRPPAPKPMPKPQPKPMPHPQPHLQPIPGSVVIIRPRPVTHRVIIYPVYHPVPIYHIYLPIYHHNSHQNQQVKMTKGACVNNKGNLFTTCQAQAAREFPLSTLNSTWRSCCSIYAEMGCYVEKAADFCSESDAKALIEHSQQVSSFFGSTICTAVHYSTWDSTCRDATKEKQLEEKRLEANSSLIENLIELPPQMGNEKACFTKLRTKPQPEGDLAQKCLDTSLHIWYTQNQTNFWDTAVYQQCCAMYDALDCLRRQAHSTCSDNEQKDLADYTRIATTAFTQGVCRAVPYDQAGKICRGETSPPPSGSRAILPSLVVTLMCALFLFVH